MEMMKRWCCGLLILGMGCGVLRAETPPEKELELKDLPPVAILAMARSMFPEGRTEVRGILATAEERGMNPTRRPYDLTLDWNRAEPKARVKLYVDMKRETELQAAEITRQQGKAMVELLMADGRRVPYVRLNTPVGESDITWMDLTLDYLWWHDAKLLTEAEIEAVDLSARTNGRRCLILEVRPPQAMPGCSAVRLWVDEGTGYMLQADQLDAEGKVLRRMWIQRVGREEGRWIPREFRIKMTGVRRVTSLHVESVESDGFKATEEVVK